MMSNEEALKFKASKDAAYGLFQQELVAGLGEIPKASTWPDAAHSAAIDAVWKELTEKFPEVWTTHHMELEGSWYLTRTYA